MAAMRIFVCFLLCVLFGNLTSAWSQNKIATEGEIPTVAWAGVPPAETSLMRYQELKDSGITYSLTLFPNAGDLAKALDVAQRVGIKIIASCPELGSDTQKTVERFMHHPALAGYFLRDEPSADEFPHLAVWAKNIHALDSEHFRYFNLLPNYASAKQLGTPSYREYVSAFAKEVPVEFLSFDHYPVVDDTLRPEWYENLEIVSDVARSAGKPFWAFALAIPHFHYPVPTLAQLRLEVFSALAYGAQGIQYFTYWTPLEDKNFQDGPITREGKRTDIYDRVKEVNSEIRGLSYVFLNARVISVAHTGAEAPLGTKRLDKLPSPVESFSTSGGTVVSLLQKGNSTFLVVVNQNYKQPIKLTIQFQSDVKRVLKDGSLVPVKHHDKNNLVEDPGDVMIWTWAS
jgi:Beta-galactosidase